MHQIYSVVSLSLGQNHGPWVFPMPRRKGDQMARDCVKQQNWLVSTKAQLGFRMPLFFTEFFIFFFFLQSQQLGFRQDHRLVWLGLSFYLPQAGFVLDKSVTKS